VKFLPLDPEKKAPVRGGIIFLVYLGLYSVHGMIHCNFLFRPSHDPGIACSQNGTAISWFLSLFIFKPDL